MAITADQLDIARARGGVRHRPSPPTSAAHREAADLARELTDVS